MSAILVTGSCGLIGSEAATYFAEAGFNIYGMDNDMRQAYFGPDASTRWKKADLINRLGSRYQHIDADIRDNDSLNRLVSSLGNGLTAIIHTAAQPSHDWAASAPLVDFHVNATGTLNLLEAYRQHAPQATFVFLSTNKVYGDHPNQLPLVEKPSRWELDTEHEWFNGIPETMSIDQSLHSLFGVSKAAADLAVQEYGRYFGLNTSCLRCGCLTGPGHSGAQLHGFLSYLARCAVNDTPYTVFGYKGKQVRDNIHSADLVSAISCIVHKPKSAAVYNLGGGRHANCSMREAIAICNEITGKELQVTYSNTNRTGDHQWWISDLTSFCTDYPNWKQKYSIRDTLDEIISDANERRA